MKTLPVIISLVFILIGGHLVAQEELIVRELTIKTEGGATQPVKEVLREYDQEQRLVSEINLRSTLDQTAWRNESKMTFEYDDQDQLVHQTKTFYSTNPERITFTDDLSWEYNAAGKQTSYRLFRENVEQNTQEGFWYAYEYDLNGCQTARTGKTWDQDLQEFILTETTTLENTPSCLPLKISSGAYQTRYEYEYDSQGRPTAEKTFQTIGGDPEELISVFTISYGSHFEKRSFQRFSSNYQYEDSVVFDEEGQTVYRLTMSNVNSGSGLEPATEYFWEYDANGNEIVQIKNQVWNELFEFWQTVSIDSTTFHPEFTIKRHELRQMSGPNTVERSSVTNNLTTFRCDGVPGIQLESYERDGQPLDFSFLTQYIYAGPPACSGFVDLDHIEVYPVPASEELHIRSALLGAGATRVRLVDMLGKTVRSETFSYTNGIIMPVHGLADGVYTLMIDFNKVLLTKKVLIQAP